MIQHLVSSFVFTGIYKDEHWLNAVAMPQVYKSGLVVQPFIYLINVSLHLKLMQ